MTNRIITPETPAVFWQIEQDRDDIPLVAAAIHDGHGARPEVAAQFALNDAERLREEDPFTARWAMVAPIRITASHSRFELDLNRPREKAVYRMPEDAWGLTVWKNGPPEDAHLERCLSDYDAFYADVYQVLRKLEQERGAFVVLDLHTYNHRRSGPDGPIADPNANPEVNIGTGTMPDRNHWATLIDRFMADLRGFDFLGRSLDVRENVKFQGGQFGRWIHENFPGSGCVLSVEFKKFFMDEWTGTPDAAQTEAIREALSATVPGLLESLAAIQGGNAA